MQNRLTLSAIKTDGTEKFPQTVGKLREKSQTEEQFFIEPSEKCEKNEAVN
jgi:hypothetical protein